MHRFLGLVSMAFLIAACQPQTNIQTGLQTLKSSLPSLSRASEDEIEYVDIEGQEVSIDAAEGSLYAATAVEEIAQNFAAELTGSILTTVSPAAIEVTALNEDETGEPSLPVAETGADVATLPNNSKVQIATLAKSDDKTTIEEDSIITLNNALNKNDLAIAKPFDESPRKPIIVTEPQKVPDPIHPKTIVGQSIDDLGTRLGLPDFERSDANAVIWQYRLAACVTDFYLYLNGDNYVVKGWAWRPPLVNQTLDEEICQKQIGMLLDFNA